MIIPVRCFTCGKLTGNKYKYYYEKVLERKIKLDLKTDQPSVIEVLEEDVKKTPEGEVLDELGCIRYCCRKTLLTHIPLMKDI